MLPGVGSTGVELGGTGVAVAVETAVGAAVVGTGDASLKVAGSRTIAVATGDEGAALSDWVDVGAMEAAGCWPPHAVTHSTTPIRKASRVI